VLIRHFVVGFCIEEQELAEMSGRRDTSPDEFKSGADPARFPLTSKALPTILTTSADERFRLGLQLMLSGI
jgi:TetR/AcrR family tetracycline transcriptional repressor